MTEDDFEDGFDVGIYGEFQEVPEEEEANSFFNDDNAPQINNIRAKYNAGESEITQIAEIKGEIKKASVEVEAQLTDTNGLRRYYGLLGELWANLKLVSGKGFISHIQKEKRKCWELILEAEKSGKINSNVYYSLLSLRNNLYRIAQLKNMGFAVEKTGHSINKAKGSITG
jgi:hypothetical protein